MTYVVVSPDNFYILPNQKQFVNNQFQFDLIGFAIELYSLQNST